MWWSERHDVYVAISNSTGSIEHLVTARRRRWGEICPIFCDLNFLSTIKGARPTRAQSLQFLFLWQSRHMQSQYTIYALNQHIYSSSSSTSPLYISRGMCIPPLVIPIHIYFSLLVFWLYSVSRLILQAMTMLANDNRLLLEWNYIKHCPSTIIENIVHVRWVDNTTQSESNLFSSLWFVPHSAYYWESLLLD